MTLKWESTKDKRITGKYVRPSVGAFYNSFFLSRSRLSPFRVFFKLKTHLIYECSWMQLYFSDVSVFSSSKQNQINCILNFTFWRHLVQNRCRNRPPLGRGQTWGKPVPVLSDWSCILQFLVLLVLQIQIVQLRLQSNNCKLASTKYHGFWPFFHVPKKTQFFSSW